MAGLGKSDQTGDEFDVANTFALPVVGVQAAGQWINFVEVALVCFAVAEHIYAGSAGATQGTVYLQANVFGFVVEVFRQVSRAGAGALRTLFYSPNFCAAHFFATFAYVFGIE